MVNESQIETEHKQIVNAPKVMTDGTSIFRCHFCGQVTEAPTPVAGADPKHEIRYKGRCCGGS